MSLFVVSGSGNRQRPGFNTELALRPPQTFEKSSELLPERSSQGWIPKPQFWYPPLRFGSQRWIPKPLFFLVSGYIHRCFGVFCSGDNCFLMRLSAASDPYKNLPSIEKVYTDDIEHDHFWVDEPAALDLIRAGPALITECH